MFFICNEMLKCYSYATHAPNAAFTNCFRIWQQLAAIKLQNEKATIITINITITKNEIKITKTKGIRKRPQSAFEMKF